MRNLFAMRFLLFTGKGGVGKTTLSAATAVAMARQGKRVLLMELNVRDRLGSLFGKEPVGREITQLASNIWAVNTTPRDAMREYAMMVLPFRSLYRPVFENRVVEKFLRVVPGLPELTMLGKAYWHERERDEAGRPVWDAVIVDAPATGHGFFLLQIPQVITRALGSGRMADEAARMLELLLDPERTMINLVTLPEEMPVNETAELASRLREEFNLRPGVIFANGVFPRPMSVEDARHLDTLTQTRPPTDDPLGQLLDVARFRLDRCALQQRYLERLHREMEAPVVSIPFYFQPALDRSAIEKIATHLTDGIERLRRSS
jgi:anion-transporting  ArsA/GET3 family ATPase